MEIKSLNGPFGAEISGLDLARRLDPATRAAVTSAFGENVVLCFRGQSFARPEDFLAAVRNLGQPMPPVTATYRLPGFDAIEELTNRAVDRRTGDEAPLMRGGSWHTDHSNLERPPKATVLYAIEVPEAGGNTEFTNLYLAYEALDDAAKEAIRGRRAFHAYLSRRAPRRLLTRTAAEEEGSSGCWQPLVREHPETGRAALYLNPMRCDAVEGMDQAEGDALLDRLYAHCDQARFQYSHRWRPGDVLIWDNRCALHQATFDFDPARLRYLHRIMLKGERPKIAA
ncbi:MAG: TauD/TfdA family dioxygenase [Alphaproteobacteria bacterium]|nr:TauD/TfdA family dioxygenase [Alphaproteobacteria bacterium]